MAVHIGSALRKIVESEVFGPVKLVSYTVDESAQLAPNFSSVIRFYKLFLADDFNQFEKTVVVKTQLTDPQERQIRDGNAMFKNEFRMYKNILPLIVTDNSNFFPKLYFGLAIGGDDFQKDVLILEDLRHKNFHFTQDIFLDLKHLKLAVKKLAIFHALSYIAKQKYKDKFIEMVSELKEAWFRQDLPRTIEAVAVTSLKRGILPLIENSHEPKLLKKFLDTLQPLFPMVSKLTKPEEPFGVLCHGDFIRNNMFFKYDETGPVDFKTFDLQSSKYSNPAVELAKLLYSNTTAKLRHEYWDDILELYWNTFEASVPKEFYCPSFEDFLDHFSRRAVFGYIPSSFTVPMMLTNNTVQMEDYKQLSDEEKNNKFLKSGGSKGTEAVVDIVKHLLDRKYISKFVEEFA